MRWIACGFRMIIVGFTAWLIAISLIVFDHSDPDDLSFRLEKSVCRTVQMRYSGCSEMPVRKLDLGETLDFYYLESMAFLHGTIADMRGEGDLDFDWLKRLQARKRAPRESSLREVSSMRRIPTH